MSQRDKIIAEDALQSEVEAYGMYTAMIKHATDKELIKVLKHNRKEEKEHAKMLDKVLGKYDANF